VTVGACEQRFADAERERRPGVIDRPSADAPASARDAVELDDHQVAGPCAVHLAPSQAERFASLVGADAGRLTLNVSGWNKLVVLDSDRVFLFPRSADGVEWFERELAAYRALAQAQLTLTPSSARSTSNWPGYDASSASRYAHASVSSAAAAAWSGARVVSSVIAASSNGRGAITRPSALPATRPLNSSS
jgi:hypothetical protein